MLFAGGLQTHQCLRRRTGDHSACRVWVFPFGLGVAPVDVAGTSEHARCPGDHDGACVDRDNRCIHAQYHRTERLLGLPAGVSPPVQL